MDGNSLWYLDEQRKEIGDLKVDLKIIELIDVNTIDVYSTYIVTEKGENLLIEKLCKDIIQNQPSFLFLNNSIQDWKCMPLKEIKRFIEKEEIDCWNDKTNSDYISPSCEYFLKQLKNGKLQEKIKELEPQLERKR